MKSGFNDSDRVTMPVFSRLAAFSQFDPTHLHLRFRSQVG